MLLMLLVVPAITTEEPPRVFHTPSALARFIKDNHRVVVVHSCPGDDQEGHNLASDLQKTLSERYRVVRVESPRVTFHPSSGRTVIIEDTASVEAIRRRLRSISPDLSDWHHPGVE